MATKHVKGRQIYLQALEIEELAHLVTSHIVGVDDDIHLCDSYLEYAKTDEDRKYWQAEKDDNLRRKTKFVALLKKLWYYG